VPGVGQKLRHPCQQDEHLQQVLGIARGDPALRVDFPRAFAAQRVERRGEVFFHPQQRAGRIDQSGQRLEPGKAGGRVLPPGEQEGRLPPQGAVNRRLSARDIPLRRNSAWLIQRICRRPVRSGVQPGPRSAPVSPRPVHHPGLSLRAPLRLGQRREIAEPGEAVQCVGERLVRGGRASTGWSRARRSARRRNGSCRPSAAARPRRSRESAARAATGNRGRGSRNRRSAPSSGRPTTRRAVRFAHAGGGTGHRGHHVGHRVRFACSHLVLAAGYRHATACHGSFGRISPLSGSAAPCRTRRYRRDRPTCWARGAGLLRR
jgi:hypothetical protein